MGEQIKIPITGNRSKRIIHGVINIKSGEIDLLITKEWNSQTHMHFLEQLRSKWRGHRIILFEDRGTPHTAEDTTELAANLGIEVRLLPRASPEMNPMDHLWKQVKRETIGSRYTLDVTHSALHACRYIISLSPKQRLIKSGVMSGRFWLDS